MGKLEHLELPCTETLTLAFPLFTLSTAALHALSQPPQQS